MVFLAPGSLNHTANIIKGFAIAIGIAIAIGFVWMWWAARRRERQMELGTRAKAAYAGYMTTAMQYPELAEPLLGGIAGPAEVVRYRHFIARFLAMADEVLLLEPTPQWRETLGRHLVGHKSYLASDEFRSGSLKDCSDEVKAVIERVTASPARDGG